SLNALIDFLLFKYILKIIAPPKNGNKYKIFNATFEFASSFKKTYFLNRFGKYSIKPVDIVTANMHVNVNIIKSLLNVISLSINIIYPVTYI
ncbi:TPA: hypothetical protein ACG0J8_004756, partial [Escherichia coli]